MMRPRRAREVTRVLLAIAVMVLMMTLAVLWVVAVPR